MRLGDLESTFIKCTGDSETKDLVEEAAGVSVGGALLCSLEMFWGRSEPGQGCC